MWRRVTPAGIEDEWGAVAQLQAEVDLQRMEEEKALVKDLQRRYKDDLDKQKQENDALARLAPKEKVSKTGLDVSDGEAFISQNSERTKKNLKDALIRKLKEKEQREELERQQRQRERDERLRSGQQFAADEGRRKAAEKTHKLEVARLLASAYSEQAREKQKTLQAERRLQQMFVLGGNLKVPSSERDRIPVFRAMTMPGSKKTTYPAPRTGPAKRSFYIRTWLRTTRARTARNLSSGTGRAWRRRRRRNASWRRYC